MALPVVPKVGGSKGGGLSLKSDMSGLGGAKSKPKVTGSLKKNPGKSTGRKMSGGKS